MLLQNRPKNHDTRSSLNQKIDLPSRINNMRDIRIYREHRYSSSILAKSV